MATGTQYSSWSAWKLPSGASNKRRVRTYYTWTTSETATTFTIAVKAYAKMEGGSATMGGNTITVSATGQSSSSGSFDFVYGEKTLHNPVNRTYTWNKTTSAQSVTVKSTFVVPSGRLFAGTYIATGTFTIPALSPATITFNANADDVTGSVPTTISTYVGVSKTIPSNSLARVGYNFTKWNTASNGSGTSYSTGSKITPSGNITLYAQWSTKYVAPTISGLTAYRVLDDADASEASPDSVLSGTRGYCEIDISGGSDYSINRVEISFGSTVVTATSSGTKYYAYSSVGSVPADAETNITVTITLTGTDSIQRIYTNGTYISKESYVIDISSDGRSVAFGGTAEDNIPIDDPNKYIFNGDLYIGGHDSPIGTRLTTTKSDIRVAAGVDNPHYGASLKLGKGTWIAMGRWSFNTRASGTTSSNRQTSIVVNGTIWMSQRINTYGGNYGAMQCVAMLVLTEESNTVVCAGSCSQATSGTNYDSSILDVIRIA